MIGARAGQRLVATHRELSALGDVEAVEIDLTDERLPEMLADLDERAGGLAAAVLSGGGPEPGRATDLDDDRLKAAYELVLRPAVSLVRVVGGSMARRGTGSIVMITSSGVREPIPNLAASNVMRAGVTALMQTASRELAPRGVRINAVAPGRIQTERVASLDRAAAGVGRPVDEVRARSIATIPMGRYGEPVELGRAVAWLCSDDPSYVTGTTLAVDGGKGSGLLG
jgi:3-oxoacyl-[acyl-carrier protein] reductase